MLKIIRPIPAEHIKLLIFDLDGTLVDSRLDIANSVNAMLEHYHRPVLPIDVVSSYIGDGAPMLIRRALGDPEDEHMVTGALEYFIGWYRAHKLDNTYVYPGILEALRKLRHGHNGTKRKMAVLSNKPVIPSRDIVKALGLEPYFFQTYGGNSFPTKKPDPLGALTLCKEAGVKPQETVIIGDTHNDTLTARNARGMWSIGLTYGLNPESLNRVPPDVLVDKPEEILLALPIPQGKSD